LRALFFGGKDERDEREEKRWGERGEAWRYF